MSLIEKLFKVKERGSSTKTEFLGAISAYLAVCYLFIVVPGMLADAGMPIGDATVATIWAAILGTLMIAFIANYPVVVAPGPRNFRVLRILRLRSHGPDLASRLRRSCDFRLRVLHFDGHPNPASHH